MTDSTEADIDILDKLARSLKPFWHHTRNDVIGDAMAAITNLRAERDAAARDMRERCAREVEPRVPRPCDCERCNCGNYGDAEAVAGWDSDAYAAKIIRALPLIATEGKVAT